VRAAYVIAGPKKRKFEHRVKDNANLYLAHFVDRSSRHVMLKMQDEVFDED
jgi:hypothetical protein